MIQGVPLYTAASQSEASFVRSDQLTSICVLSSHVKMSYSLNSSKGVIYTIGGIKGDTRSLDYGSYETIVLRTPT